MKDTYTTITGPTDVGTTPTPRSRQQQSIAKRRHEERQRHRREAQLGSLKKCCLYILTGTAIASSVVAIYSCAFFSYRDTAVQNYNADPGDDIGFQNSPIRSRSIDHNKNGIESNGNGQRDSSFQNLSYAPFEDLAEASVGLFSYSVYFSSACFRYYDDATEYSLFESNRNDSIDLWILARYCSVLAPAVAFLAFALLLLEWLGCRLARHGGVVTYLLFSMAAVLQFGTFVLLLAPSTLSFDDSESSGEAQAFCFSKESTIHCRFDSGAWFSMGSAIAYIVLALTSTTPKKTDHDDASRNDNEDGEPRHEECCGGYCLVKKPFRLPRREIYANKNNENNDDHRQKKKHLWVREMGGDTSSGSSFGNSNSHSSSNSSCDDDDQDDKNENDRGEGQVERCICSNCRFNNIQQAFVRFENNNDRSTYSQPAFVRFESNNDRCTLIEPERHAGSPNTSRHRTIDFQHDDDDDSYIDDEEHSIIIREVKSIGTEHVRTGAACCYCAETVVQPNAQEHPTETMTPATITSTESNNKMPTQRNIRSWQRARVTMTSMLSEDTDLHESDDDEEVGGAAAAAVDTTNNAPSSHHETSSAVAECEAIFMAELEASQMEHGGNWQNSQFKKAFDFVRS